MNVYLKPNKFYWANANWKESKKKSRNSTDIELDKVSESIKEFVDHKDHMLTITRAATRRGLDVTSGQPNAGRNCIHAVSISQIQ